MALAYASGASKESIKQKSMMTGEDGLVTYLLKSEKEVRAISYAYKILQNNFDESIWSKAKGMKILNNNTGVAFDMPEQVAEELDQNYKEQSCSKKTFNFTLERATEVPDLLEHNSYYSKPHKGGYKNHGYNNGHTTQRYKKHYNDLNDHNYKYSRNNDFYKSKDSDYHKPSFKHSFNNDIKFSDSKPTFSRNKNSGGFDRPMTDRTHYNRPEFASTGDYHKRGRFNNRGSRGARGRGRY